MDSVEPLLSRTQKLLKVARLSYGKIAEGAGLDKNWVAKFCQGNIGEPGVTKVQAVHDFLSGYVATMPAAPPKRPGEKVA
jgi:transcriptional regulator with XRE-family HTH domain